MPFLSSYKDPFLKPQQQTSALKPYLLLPAWIRFSFNLSLKGILVCICLAFHFVLGYIYSRLASSSPSSCPKFSSAGIIAVFYYCLLLCYLLMGKSFLLDRVVVTFLDGVIKYLKKTTEQRTGSLSFMVCVYNP